MAESVSLEQHVIGWRILICVGMSLPFISGLAALPSFGLVFGDFLRSIGAETGVIALITSAFFCAFSFAGLLSSPLFSRFGLRTVGLVGGILYFVGSFAQIFVDSVIGLLISFSLVQGIGFGLIVPTSYTTFNNYFVETRVMWMSFTQSLIGLGAMCYPIIMQKLLNSYGFRGCLIVLASINSHAILGMLLMQPVEWHVRSAPSRKQETHARKTSMQLKMNVSAGSGKIQNYVKDMQEDTKLVSHLEKRQEEGSEKVFKNNFKIPSSRSSSITSLGNWSGAIVVSDASPEMTHRCTSRQSTIISVHNSLRSSNCWTLFVAFLDLTLMKNPIYINIVLGTSFALYSDIAFFTIQPLYLFELGFDKYDTANIIAIGAAADLASRIILAISAGFIQIRSRYIYLAGSIFTICSRLIFVNVSDYTSMVYITAVMGFLRTWLHVPLPLVFAEYLSKDRFASGYGLFMFLQGNIMFAIGPIIGYLRDQTKDYILIFHCLSFFMALCAVPWLIEIILLKICKPK